MFSLTATRFGLVVCFMILACYGEIDVGKHLTTCNRNSPDVNDCLVDAVQSGLAVMANGIEEWGVPPVDPYLQKELKVEHKRNLIKAKMVMKDILVSGLKGSTVKDARLKADDDHFSLEIKMFTPRVFVSGTYHGEGKYNALRIDALGDFNSTMKWPSMVHPPYTWKLEGRPEIRDGKTHMRIYSFYMSPDVGTMKSYISNENPDSQPWTEIGNQFANDNWRILYREMLPYAQANWNKTGIKIANKLFLQIPYEQLFPDKS